MGAHSGNRAIIQHNNHIRFPVSYTHLSGNLRESQERPWQLSVGWSGQDVDMLATLPQEGEDMLLRYTLSQDQQDGTQTISQRMHLLSAEAGESYDSAAELSLIHI